MSKSKAVRSNAVKIKEKETELKLNKSNSSFWWVAPLLIIILGLIIYSNTYDCSFQFDDKHNIIDYEPIRSLSNWKITHSRILAFYSFALNYHFDMLNVKGYHVVNVIIHLINSCLVFWLVQLVFSTPIMKNKPSSEYAKSIAFVTALMFVSHPLATGSVTYIVQRMASMVAMFYLMSVAMYIKARITESSNRFLFFGGSILSFIMAILTKENAFSLPIIIVFIEFFFLQTNKLRINFKDYRILLFALSVIGFFVFTIVKYSSKVFKPLPPSIYNDFTITPLNYFYTQLSVIVKYIQLLVLPINQSVDHDFPLSNSLFNPSTFINGSILLILLVLAVILFNRNRLISFCIFWFFITLSIESSFIPISDLIFEHRTYLPSFGFFLILSSGMYLLLWDRLKQKLYLVFALLIGIYAVLAFQRNKVWKDEISLWTDAILKSPTKARPYINRGYAYGNAQQWDKAIPDFKKVTELFPTKHAAAYYNLGLANWTLGKKDLALNYYSKAIEVDSKYADAMYGRAVCYHYLNEPDKAIADYSKVIVVNPKYDKAYYSRGLLYANKGQWSNAIDDYSKGIEISPKNFNFYLNRGIVYGQINMYQKAFDDFNKVIELDPNNKSAYSYREMASKQIKTGN